jgi:hypothetical protein
MNAEKQEGNEIEPVVESAPDLQIEEMEELAVPLKWVCACSTTCKCTTTSCGGWSL